MNVLGKVRRRAGAGMAGVTAAAVLAACGSAGVTSGHSSAGSGSTAAPSSSSGAAVAEARKQLASLQNPITSWPGITRIANPVSVSGKKIMIVPFADTVAILHGMAVAAQQALQHMGADVTICDGKASPTSVASCLNEAQTQHYFAVATDFVAYPMDSTAFNSLAASGTRVVIGGDTPVTGQSYPPRIQFYDSTASLTKVFANEADAAVADEGARADVLSLDLTDTATQLATDQAVAQRFKALCPACTLVQVRFSTSNATQLASTVSAELTSHPGINAIIVPVDTFVPMVLQGVQSAGFTGKAEIISTGSDLAGLQRVASGQVAHDFGSSAVFDGYGLANAVMQAVSGEKVTPGHEVTRDFNKSTVQGLDLAPSEYYTADWFGNSSFETAFYQAWGGN